MEVKCLLCNVLLSGQAMKRLIDTLEDMAFYKEQHCLSLCAPFKEEKKERNVCKMKPKSLVA